METWQPLYEAVLKGDAATAKTVQTTAGHGVRSFSQRRAIGMIQPSSRKTEGRKLYTLIGTNGSRRAYLDAPPGIDVESLLAHRVGVRGAVRYNEDLGARLITVRDIEEIGGRE